MNARVLGHTYDYDHAYREHPPPPRSFASFSCFVFRVCPEWNGSPGVSAAEQLGILIENMRREGYEFCVSPPRVLTTLDEEGNRLEPIEEVRARACWFWPCRWRIEWWYVRCGFWVCS